MTETLERRDCSREGRVILVVVGSKGAIHYWHSENAGSKYGGVEAHWRERPEWASKGPDRNDCWILGGPCWHDGSSLWAEETMTPLWETCTAMNDMEPFWRRLERAYRERIVGDE